MDTSDAAAIASNVQTARELLERALAVDSPTRAEELTRKAIKRLNDTQTITRRITRQQLRDFY
jgi:hypothetical protein